MHSDNDMCIHERKRKEEETHHLRGEQCKVLSPKHSHDYGLEESGRDRIFWLTADLRQRTVRKTSSLVFKWVNNNTAAKTGTEAITVFNLQPLSRTA